MTLQELIRRFRVRAHDNVEPYLWSNQDVTDWLNEAEQQACLRGRLLREAARQDVCRMVLDPAQSTYVLHPAVTEITHMRVIPGDGGRSRVVLLKSPDWLDAYVPDWRDEDQPVRMAIQDDCSLSLVGTISAGDVLMLECYRLPMASMADMADVPEIHQAHHEHLIDWALYRAFSVPDADAFDPKRSEQARQDFTAYFGEPPDKDMLRSTRHDVIHHTAPLRFP